jgi:hypothetical protein
VELRKRFSATLGAVSTDKVIEATNRLVVQDPLSVSYKEKKVSIKKKNALLERPARKAVRMARLKARLAAKVRNSKAANKLSAKAARGSSKRTSFKKVLAAFKAARAALNAAIEAKANFYANWSYSALMSNEVDFDIEIKLAQAALNVAKADLDAARAEYNSKLTTVCVPTVDKANNNNKGTTKESADMSLYDHAVTITNEEIKDAFVYKASPVSLYEKFGSFFARTKGGQVLMKYLAVSMADTLVPMHVSKDPTKLNEKREKLIKQGAKVLESVRSSVKSSSDAQLWFTLKVLDSSDRTLKGWKEGEPHGQMLKLAFTADDQWASAFNKHFQQLCELVENIGIDSSFLRKNLKFEDVLFVQNLKDRKGREANIDNLNAIVGDMGYTPVTPGFWLKERDESGNLTPLCQWFANIFPSYKEMRARARGITTTPIIARLDKLANGRTTKFYVGNFETTGQVGADGGNDYSYTLDFAEVTESVVQIRIHTPWLPLDGADFSGFQAKGQMHRAGVWAKHVDGNKYCRVYEDTLKKSQHGVGDLSGGVFLHYDNVKGTLSKELETLVLSLEPDEVICLNDYWYERADLENIPADARRLLGGVIAEDNPAASSSVSWQDTILRSVAVMLLQEEAWRKQINNKLSKLYSNDNQVINMLFGDESLQSAAKAMSAMNPRQVQSLVFGAGRKMKTRYCEQIDMPQKYCVMDKVPEGKKKGRTHLIEGVNRHGMWANMPVVTLTGQPQLYHHSLVNNWVITHEDLKMAHRTAASIAGVEIVKDLTLAKDTNKIKIFLADFMQHIKTKDGLEDDELKMELYKRLRSIYITISHSPKLIWMNKETQDRLQRDSDGDRILFAFNEWVVKAVELHEEAIRNLPMPSVEVSKDTPMDGDEEVMNLKPFSYGGNKDLKKRALKYLCAPQQGMGPVGFLVNLCSVVLAHILWVDSEDGWGPDPEIRDQVLKFYAVMVLLVQNALDRQKKPWLPVSLLRWFEVSDKIFQEPLTGGKDYPGATMEEAFPTMGLGQPVAMRKVRLNKDEQYNIAGLKLFVCWAINFVKLGYKFETAKKWSEDMQVIANHFASVIVDEDLDVEIDWSLIASTIDTAKSADEVEAGWVWPSRLYGWKKEASLEHKLYDAPPALNLLSQWVVEENKKVKEDKGLDISPERLIYKNYHLSSSNMSQDKSFLDQAENFIKAFSTEYLRGKAKENDKMTQSEFYTNRGENDANEYLDLMKDALREMESYWPLVKQIADRALINPESAKSKWNKKECILSFAKLLHAVWAEKGYIDWLANRKPLDYLAFVAATNNSDYFANTFKASREESFDLDSCNYGQKVMLKIFDCVGVKNPTPRNLAKIQALQSRFENAWYNAETLVPAIIKEIGGFGNAAAHKLRELLPSLILVSDEKTLWSELIWSDFMPALDVQLDLAEVNDVKVNYFAKGDGIQELLTAVQQDVDTPAKIKEIFGSLYKSIILSIIAREMKDNNILNPDSNLEFKELIEDFQGDSSQKLNLIIGYLKSKGKAPKTRELMAMGSPIMQAVRVKNLLLKQFPEKLKTSTEEEKKQTKAWLDTTIKSLLVDEWQYTFVEDGDTRVGVNRTLKGRVDYPVSNATVADIAGELAREHSFYLLQPVTNFWISRKDQPKIGVTKRWVCHDSLMYKILGRNPVEDIQKELSLNLGIGHIFSGDELKIISAIATGQNLREKDASWGERIDYIKDRLDNSDMYGKFVYNQQDSDLLTDKTFSGNVHFPYHWGGNAKYKKSIWGFRSSIYRPVWRFIMTVLPDGHSGFDGKSLKDSRFELFETLTGSTLLPGGKKKGVNDNKALSKEDKIVELVKTFSMPTKIEQGNTWRRSELDAKVNPVLCMTRYNGFISWMKIPKSPQPEILGHLATDGETYGMFVDLDAGGSDWFNIIKLNEHGDVVPAFDERKDAEEFRSIFLRRTVTGQVDVEKANGMFPAYRVLTYVRTLIQTCNNDESLKAYGEFVLGLLHATSLADSYVLKNWQAHADRIQGKTPKAIKRMLSHDKDVNFVTPSKAYFLRLIETNVAKKQWEGNK